MKEYQKLFPMQGKKGFLNQLDLVIVTAVSLCFMCCEGGGVDAKKNGAYGIARMAKAFR